MYYDGMFAVWLVWFCSATHIINACMQDVLMWVCHIEELEQATWGTLNDLSVYPHDIIFVHVMYHVCYVCIYSMHKHVTDI